MTFTYLQRYLTVFHTVLEIKLIAWQCYLKVESLKDAQYGFPFLKNTSVFLNVHFLFQLFILFYRTQVKLQLVRDELWTNITELWNNSLPHFLNLLEFLGYSLAVNKTYRLK